MKDRRKTIVRLLTTTVLVLAGIVLLVLYRQIKAFAGGAVTGTQLQAFHAAQSSGLIGAIEGPFVINGMDVEIVPSSDGARDLAALVEALLTDGWEETIVEQAAEVEEDLLSDYRVLQRGDESRFLLAMDWLGGIAVLTVPLDQEVVSPLPSGNGQWADVPGEALPGVLQPIGARQILNIRFSGGGHVCYQLPPDSEEPGPALEDMARRMARDGWIEDPVPGNLGMRMLRLGEAACLIWSPPPVEGAEYVAVLLTGLKKERTRDGKNEEE